MTESPSVCRLATCSVTRSSAHLASVKCSFLHHCHSLSSLSPSSRICNSRACVYKICLPYCYHYLPNSVFPSLFFGRLFVALLTNRKSFLFSQSFLATQSMCVLSSPFLKKLGGRESRGLQTSWGFGWLLHIFLLLSSRFVSPVGVFLSNNFLKNCSFIGEIVIRKWGHLQMELLSVL